MKTYLKALSAAGLLAGACVAMSATGPALAGPANISHTAIASPPSLIIEARARRTRNYRNNGVGPAAVLGMFGAIVGTVIANDRYNNYDNYSYRAYGYSDDYGYRRGYGPRRTYVPGNYPSGFGVYRGW